MLIRTCSGFMAPTSVPAEVAAESLCPLTLAGGDREPDVPSKLQLGDGSDIVGESKSAKFKSGDRRLLSCC